MLLGAGAQPWSLPTGMPFQIPTVGPVPTSAILVSFFAPETLDLEILHTYKEWDKVTLHRR